MTYDTHHDGKPIYFSIFTRSVSTHLYFDKICLNLKEFFYDKKVASKIVWEVISRSDQNTKFQNLVLMQKKLFFKI